MSERPNPIWETLAKRAEQKTTQALTALVEEKRKRALLAQRERQIEDMRVDYTRRLLEAERAAHRMSDSVIYRRFLAQVATLRRALDGAVADAERSLAAAQKRHDEADRERLRMKFLAERELEKVTRAQKAKDQRDLDAIGIRQFLKQRKS